VVQTDPDSARARGAADANADVGADTDTDTDAARSRRFEQLALPHLDAAYNLARWLCGNAHDAEDVVQEAFMRAFRFFDTFRGDSARPWLLAIVRRTWYTEWRRRAPSHEMLEFDETMDDATFDGWSAGADDPQTLLIRDEDVQQVHDALARLPVEYREVLILRELEEMGYREIALVADMPIGTVMSRLARGRRKLAEVLRGERGAVRKDTRSAPDTREPARCSELMGGEPGKAAGLTANAGAPPFAIPDDRHAQSTRTGRDGEERATLSTPRASAAEATVTQIRAFADGRPLNIPGTAADPAQETPDGL